MIVICLYYDCCVPISCLAYVVFAIMLGYVSLAPYLGSILTYLKPMRREGRVEDMEMDKRIMPGDAKFLIGFSWGEQISF
jgi:hypothetical protein